MAKPKTIPKKIQKEVLRQDAFKCVFCGQSAPDVYLHICYIIPAESGGKASLDNLTAICGKCCNQPSTAKQQQEQFDMYTEWLKDNNYQTDHILEQKVDVVCEHFKEIVQGYSVNDNGRINIRKDISRFGFNAVIQALNKSAKQYLRQGADGKHTQESVEKVLEYVPRICFVEAKKENDPSFAERAYIKGIMRNRFQYFHPYKAEGIIQDAHERGVPLSDIKEAALTATSWTAFGMAVRNLIEQYQQ